MPFKQLIMFYTRKYKWAFALVIVLLVFLSLLPFITSRAGGNKDKIISFY